MQWTELNDYIYVPDAENQRLVADDIFRLSPTELLVLGFESHTENYSYVTDPDYTTYVYNEYTGILTKLADDLREVLQDYVAANFGRSFAMSPSAQLSCTGITSIYGYNLVVATVFTGISNGSTSLDGCTFFLNAAAGGYVVLWDTFTLGMYTEIDTGTPGTTSNIFCHYFTSMIKLPLEVVLIQEISVSSIVSQVHTLNISAAYLYQNTNKNIRPYFASFNPTFKYLHKPASSYTYYKVKSTGLEPFLEEVEESSLVEDGNFYNLTEIAYVISSAEIKYLGGTALLSERRVKARSVLGGIYGISGVTRLLRKPSGDILDTETETGTSLGLTYRHSCATGASLETYYMTEFLSVGQKVSEYDRYAYDLYNGSNFHGDGCANDYWRAYTLPYGWDWDGPYGRFYVWNTGLVLSILRTNYPDSEDGYITFLGGDRAWLSFIDKDTDVYNWDPVVPLYGTIGYYLTDYIYVLLRGEKIVRLNWRLGLRAKPSSITTFEDIDNKYLTIGGRSDYPRQLEEATFFEDGEEVEPEQVLQYYKNSALYIRVNVPDLTSSGVLTATTRVDVVSPDGESLVKHHAGGTLVHGDILPHRLLYVTPYVGYEDWSYNLPSGVSTSVDFMGDTAHISLDNKVYRLVGSGWQEVFTTTPITTALITEDDYIFVGHSGTSPSVHKYLSSIEQADFGLPDNLIVLDLEEEYYADR